MSRRKNFPLRIPHKLYEEIQKMASKELRSVNGQMEYLLTFATRKINGPKEKPSDTSDSQSSDEETG